MSRLKAIWNELYPVFMYYPFIALCLLPVYKYASFALAVPIAFLFGLLNEILRRLTTLVALTIKEKNESSS